MTILWTLACTGLGLKLSQEHWNIHPIHVISMQPNVPLEQAIAELEAGVLRALAPGHSPHNCRVRYMGTDLETGIAVPNTADFSLFPDTPAIYLWQFTATAARKNTPSYPTVDQGFFPVVNETTLKQIVDKRVRDISAKNPDLGDWYARAVQYNLDALPTPTGHTIEWWPLKWVA